MRNEIDARLWADHHEEFSRTIEKALRHIWIAFCRLSRRQYEAPWKPRDTSPC